MSELLLEPAPCPVCSGVPDAVVRRARSWLDDVGGTYEVRACSSCGMWVTSPRPRRDELHKVYPAGYHRRRAPDLAPRAEAPGRGAFLDVGCGVGDALAAARSQGWKCSGIEISEEAADIARSRGFEVRVGDVQELELGEGQYDHIRCAHVLEHLPAPGEVLAKLARALRAEGEILVVVPNRRSFTSLVFRRYWYHLDVPRHLSHFRPRDVAELASRSGLHVRAARHTGSPSGLLGSVDCLLGGRTHLRSRTPLRRPAQVVAVPLARLRLADVVEYRLVRQAGNTRLA